MNESYLAYEKLGSPAIFVGNNKDQIIRTIEAHIIGGNALRLRVPQERHIVPIDGDVHITIALPYAIPKHRVDARVTSRAVLHVNANAVDYLKNLASDCKKLKVGDLFELDAGNPHLGLWYLPEDIMQGINAYGWKEHELQIKEWLGERAKRL